jgi:hypothetical protein
MANQHAKRQTSEEKVHGDTLKSATAAKPRSSPTQKDHAIPAADNGSHARSQAAHLGGRTQDHTKPAGDLRHYEQEREPPMEVSRAGKDYRRQ